MSRGIRSGLLGMGSGLPCMLLKMWRVLISFLKGRRRGIIRRLAGLLVCYAGMMVLVVVMYVSMRVENRRRNRDSLSLPGDRQAILDGLKDMTDMELKHFRYVL